MTKLPAFSDLKAWRYDQVFPRTVSQVPEFGFYCISGKINPCPWPVLFDHGFRKLTDHFRNTWVAGPDLNAALETGEVELTRVWGHYYDPSADPVTETAFQRHVAHYYQIKQTTTDPIARTAAKLNLNSLYGKTIQTTREWDGPEIINRPGGLFLPEAASLICSLVRAYVHRAEHRVKALHVATDGILYQGDKLDPFPVGPRSGVGTMGHEFTADECVILRNKTYICYSHHPTHNGKPLQPSTVVADRWILKEARHGLPGCNVHQLERMVWLGERSYIANHRVTLKEAMKSSLSPNQFIKLQMHTDIPAIRDLPRVTLICD